MARARQVVVLCDAQKFGHLSMVQVAELSQMHVLVTDAEPPEAMVAALAKSNVRVLVARD
jgi:DeoR/GlpR family transcriptional regulator of sugar metabolism